MAEYIKRSDVMSTCERYSQHCFETSDARGQDIADRILDDVCVMPVADVVEVVRCRNCTKRIGESITGETFCLIHEVCVPYDYYCKSGERKDEDGKDKIKRQRCEI